MKKLFFVFIVAAKLAFGQDQIILRSTSKLIWDELKIEQITIDSIRYLPAGKKAVSVTLPVKDIIAYRKGYDNDPPFIFPDVADKERYVIKNGRAVDKTLASASQKEIANADLETLLRPHSIMEEFSEKDLSNNNKVVLVKRGSGKKVKKKRNARIYIVFNKDPNTGYGRRIALKNYKFTTDSMLFFKFQVKHETKYYSARISDLMQIGIQTPGRIVGKICLGLGEFVLGLPTGYISILGIRTMIRPMYKKFKMDKWDVVVSAGQ